MSKGDGFFIEEYIDFYEDDDDPDSLVVVDDGELLDIQIVYTLWRLKVYRNALFLDINAIDRTQ
jgi:hypothetical protein